MKFWIPFVIIIAVLVFIFYPPINTERICYDVSQAKLDNLSTNVLNQRINHDTECSQRMDILFNLESCVRDATKSSIIATYANDTIQRLVAVIRPYAENLWKLKTSHNNACSDFTWYQLP